MQIRINDNVSPTLSKLARSVSDLSPVFRQYGAYQDGATDDLFKSESDPYGRNWESLSPSTIKNKSRKKQIQKTLQATGRMRASTVSQSFKREFVHGFNDPKAKFHDLGTKHMPKRQLLPDDTRGLSSKSVKELESLVEDYLNRSWS